MANDSSTGGYLSPAATPAPLEDDALDAVLQGAVAALTGLAGSMVRPRWQPKPPKRPENSIDWCAIGVQEFTPDAGPSIRHEHAPTMQHRSQRHEDIAVLSSFYGPNGGALARRLRDGLGIPQNIETLNAQGLSFIDCGVIRKTGERVNQLYYKRHDMGIRFRRNVERVYPVLSLVAAEIDVIEDSHNSTSVVPVNQ